MAVGLMLADQGAPRSVSRVGVILLQQTTVPVLREWIMEKKLW